MPRSIPLRTRPDHNSIKGYTAVYIVKEMTERIGGFDNSQFSDQLHCATITVDDEPGVLLDVSYDANGDIDRESYIVSVVNGVGEIVATVLRSATSPTAVARHPPD
jgi:branched-chain amino acid transport system substrate-binding protein